MKPYWQAITSASELGNMPDPHSKPGAYIIWAEDICQLISDIYQRDYDEVCNDLRDELVDQGIIELKKQ